MTWEELPKEVENLWESYKLIYNWAVSWNSINFSKNKQKDIVYCIGGERLRKKYISIELISNNWNHGMSDLLLWNLETKDIKFSNVKRENDKYLEEQKRRIQYLSKIGMNV